MQSPSTIEARTHMRGEGEAARAALVEGLGLIGARSTHLDVVARRAARIMSTTIGAVTVLVRDEQHLIARTGIEANVTARASSFCTHVTERRRPLTIRDTTRAPFFVGSPMMGFTADSIRAYSGVPISLPDGTVVAVLCAADSRSRTFTAAQIAALHQLADTARAILLPTLNEPPAQARPTMRHIADDLPGSHQDDLSEWTDPAHRPAPDEKALAEAPRRAECRWSSRLLRR